MDVFQMGPQELLVTGGALAAKAFVILIAAAAGCALLRGATAAFRHLCWTLAVASVLLLPVTELIVPEVSVGFPFMEQPVSRSAIQAESLSGIAAEAASPDGVAGAGQVVGGHSISIDMTAPIPEEMATGDQAFLDETVIEVSGAALTGLPWGLLISIWSAVTLLLLFRLSTNVFRARVLVRRAVTIEDDVWLKPASNAARALGLRRTVRLLWTTDVAVPLAWGERRPVVLIPVEGVSWSAEKIRCVLTHELAHIKRHDGLAQYAADIACALHWFNPLMWYAAHRMRIEREMACDASVLLSARTKASSYAAYLLDIARGSSRCRPTPVAVPMAHRSQLEGRLNSILENGPGAGFGRVRSSAIIVLGAALVCMLAAMQPVAGVTPSTHDVRPDVAAVVLAAPPEEHVDSRAVVHVPETSSVQPTADAAVAPESAATGQVAVNVVTVPDVIRRTFDVSLDGLLEIDTEMGNIRILTADQSTVDVEVHRDARGSANEDDLEVEFDQADGRVEVVGRRSGGRTDRLRIDFVVTVPRVFNLDLETSGGNIAVADLEGTVDVSTAGGNLSFGNMSGSIDGHTSGGNISVEGSDGNVEVSTSGGNITLGRVGGTVDVRTSGGNITVEEVHGHIQAVTSGGRITARLAAQPQGDCLLRTSGGGITVYLAEDIQVDLAAETSGGSVETDVSVLIDGSVERGQLHGRINGGGPRLELDTSAGNIRIHRL